MHLLILNILSDFLPDLVPTVFSVVKNWDIDIFNETCKDPITSPVILKDSCPSIAVIYGPQASPTRKSNNL